MRRSSQSSATGSRAGASSVLSGSRYTSETPSTVSRESRSSNTADFKYEFPAGKAGERVQSGASRSGRSSRSSQVSTGTMGVDEKHIRVYVAKRSMQRSNSTHMKTDGSSAGDTESYANFSRLQSPDTERPRSSEMSQDRPKTPAHKSKRDKIAAKNQPTSSEARPSSAMRKSPSMPEIHKLTPYWTNWVSKLTDGVYLGAIESAYNANLLCRLNIEYIVDVSNVERSDIPRDKLSSCPCLCAREIPHSRMIMKISFPEDETKDISHYFDDINKFILRAVAAKKGLLIHSYFGRNRNLTIAVQYMMFSQNLPRQVCQEKVKSLVKSYGISPNFTSALEKWDSILASRKTLEKLQPVQEPKLQPLIPRKAAWL